MALKKEDHWLAIVGLGGLAFGYWYYKSHSSSTASSDSSSADTSATDTTPNVVIPGYDLAAENTVGPGQVYYQGGNASGTTTPEGTPAQPSRPTVMQPQSAMPVGTVATNGQHLALPMNS
jgi:hypothetical protein